MCSLTTGRQQWALRRYAEAAAADTATVATLSSHERGSSPSLTLEPDYLSHTAGKTALDWLTRVGTVLLQALKSSGIGKVVNRFAKKDADKDVKAAARAVIDGWKALLAPGKLRCHSHPWHSTPRWQACRCLPPPPRARVRARLHPIPLRALSLYDPCVLVSRTAQAAPAAEATAPAAVQKSKPAAKPAAAAAAAAPTAATPAVAPAPRVQKRKNAAVAYVEAMEQAASTAARCASLYIHSGRVLVPLRTA